MVAPRSLCKLDSENAAPQQAPIEYWCNWDSACVAVGVQRVVAGRVVVGRARERAGERQRAAPFAAPFASKATAEIVHKGI